MIYTPEYEVLLYEAVHVGHIFFIFSAETDIPSASSITTASSISATRRHVVLPTDTTHLAESGVVFERAHPIVPAACLGLD